MSLMVCDIPLDSSTRKRCMRCVFRFSMWLDSKKSWSSRHERFQTVPTSSMAFAGGLSSGFLVAHAQHSMDSHVAWLGVGSSMSVTMLQRVATCVGVSPDTCTLRACLRSCKKAGDHRALVACSRSTSSRDCSRLNEAAYARLVSLLFQDTLTLRNPSSRTRIASRMSSAG